MTPRLLEREFEAARMRAINAYKRDMTLAWHSARFNALTKSKTGLQPLTRYLSEVNDGEDGKQSPEAMLAAVQMMSGQLGIPMRRAAN